MAKAYATEMTLLGDTIRWADTADIGLLRQAVAKAATSPLRAIGSGGSLTAAHALAAIHEHATGQIAAIATPLDVTGDGNRDVAHWLLSAGGSNVDIIAAMRRLIRQEPRQLAVLCGRHDSPLAALCDNHPYTELHVYPPPAGKDGFLATNSLLGFVALLLRAYTLEFFGADRWNAIVAAVRPLAEPQSESSASWESSTARLWDRQTTIVLHGASTRIGAVDLESKFTEAALGNLQIADYRNFAHGRHHWLAKRGAQSAILAFIADDDRVLAERTLALIPDDIPVARIALSGPPLAALLASLVAALRITGWAGPARDIDPGRPGVPDFGRKLYHLPLPRMKTTRGGLVLADRDAAAIERKAGLSVARLHALGELDRWRSALESFRTRLHAQTFAGIVLDYDGTVVDTRHRFELPTAQMQAVLRRLIESGVTLAIATGRGASVRRDLQAWLPAALWPQVIIGYYNGAEISSLTDDYTPDGSATPCDALAALAQALRHQPELATCAKQTDRRFQITLETARVIPEHRLWDIAHQVILLSGCGDDVVVTRSSHSIDIVAANVSKAKVLAEARKRIAKGAILAIGDRGRWPGNDYALLREPFALSVDEISVDPETCWNLAPCGQRGIAATIDYLEALELSPGGVRFTANALQ